MANGEIIPVDLDATSFLLAPGQSLTLLSVSIDEVHTLHAIVTIGALMLTACALGGAAAGLAGMAEVAAVHGSANASLIAGYGYAGIVIAFIARHHPLAIVPVALFVGGLAASGGMLQRRLDLPDATVLVLQGVAFMLVLASETLYGRLRPRTATA